MRRAGGGMGLAFAAALLLSALYPASLLAQVQPPAQSLLITAQQAATWSDGPANVVQLDGPVTIQLDRTKLSARNAVVWVRDVIGGQPGEQAISVALLGEARVEQPDIRRSGNELFVTARVNGPIRITAENRLARDLRDSPTYRAAQAVRQQNEVQPDVVPGLLDRPIATTIPTSRPATTGPSTRPVHAPILYHADQIETIMSSDGRVALVLTGSVAITRTQPNGEYLEMQADRAVLFTTLQRLRDVRNIQEIHSIEEAITAAYLEGDVRISLTPAQATKGEQRLEANRVYYEFTTDRAILTDAVINSWDPQRGIPAIVRAQTVRQLSEGEYRAKKAELTTSGFAVPSYSIRADKAYVRQEDTGDPRYGQRTTFVGNNVTFDLFHVPIFYLPWAAGVVTEKGSALRQLEVGHSNKFGTFGETRWGLLETLGILPPEDFDSSFTLDYYSDRGPAGGLDADYGGSLYSDTTRQAWNFQGKFRSYFVPNDTGVDDLGRRRALIDPTNDFRGRVRWEHQQALPDDWTLQLRAGWTSDATFLEEWFRGEFAESLPLETSLYLKRQRDTEAITFLTSVQANNVVTSSDLVQEQFEVERVPEIGYYRIGDSLADDRLTFFSQNTLGRERFNVSGRNIGDLGFKFKRNVRPGQPSLGLVGVSGLTGPPVVPEDFDDRGDFRQEIDYPLAAGEIKILPYVFGRYTGYSDSPEGGRIDRGTAGAGIRFNTQFWKIDDAAQSDLFDIHRVRHIIEPEVHLFTSASNYDPSDLFIYDETIDRTFDVSAVQLALRQRWQTKRGGPGRERSVDFFTLNIEANLYANQPSKGELIPDGFRGLFYPSMPEASIPRNSINGDASWRISDTTLMVADAQFNLDEQDLATASIGLIAARDVRTMYFVGLRYIEALHSAIGTFAMNYQLSPKYSVGFRQSYDFADTLGVYSSVTVQRRFDRFFLFATAYNDSTSGENGFGFGFYPEGLGRGLSTDELQSSFAKQR